MRRIEWVACRHEGCEYRKNLILFTDEEARAIKAAHEYNNPDHREGWWEYYSKGLPMVAGDFKETGEFRTTGPVS